MAKNISGEEKLSVVLVDQSRGRAIVPAGGDRLLTVPEGSVTVDAIRRAARRVGEKGGRNIAAIAEATIDGQRHRLEPRPAEVNNGA